MNQNINKEITPESIGKVLDGMISRMNEELYAMTQEEIFNNFRWEWDDNRSHAWNMDHFIDRLERYTKQCRRWEEEKNGICCVAELVRSKYAMPRIKEFLIELKKQSGAV